MLTIAQVFSLADTITPQCRALILLAVFTGLRWGELAALRRCDIDLDGQIVRVMRQLSEMRGNAPAFVAPKSDAGRRAVVIPAVITPDLTWHLAQFTAPGDDALVFTSRNSAPLRHTNFRRRHWLPACAKPG